MLVDFEKIAIEGLRPSLVNLSYVLRHPETWPEGFVWDFKYCQQCAMGLAHQLWGTLPPLGKNVGLRPHVSSAARLLAMDYDEAFRIFSGDFTRRWWRLNRMIPHAKITPNDVADAIDAYITR